MNADEIATGFFWSASALLIAWFILPPCLRLLGVTWGTVKWEPNQGRVGERRFPIRLRVYQDLCELNYTLQGSIRLRYWITGDGWFETVRIRVFMDAKSPWFLSIMRPLSGVTDLIVVATIFKDGARIYTGNHVGSMPSTAGCRNQGLKTQDVRELLTLHVRAVEEWRMHGREPLPSVELMARCLKDQSGKPEPATLAERSHVVKVLVLRVAIAVGVFGLVGEASRFDPYLGSMLVAAVAVFAFLYRWHQHQQRTQFLDDPPDPAAQVVGEPLDSGSHAIQSRADDIKLLSNRLQPP